MMSDDSIEEMITNEKKEAEAVAKKTNRTADEFSTEEAADRAANAFGTEAADRTTKTVITTV